MKKTVTFLLFSPVLCPGGGMKIILEYANRLVAAGYDVNIVYPATLNWRKRDLKYKLKSIYHYFLHERTGWKCSRWFNLDPRVKELHTFSLNFSDVPKSNIYIATEVRTAPYVAEYPVEKKQKFYLIQDYENWFVSDREVRASYHLPLNKIVIADWLADLIRNEETEECTVVKNAFDSNYFKLTNPIENRNPMIVSTLYHEAPRKDFQTAFEAFKLVKKQYPNLQVKMFGTPPRPSFLPDWVDYTQRPDKEKHNAIYNESAIFVGSSKMEGWGLTLGEAMICGAAVACTDTKGYREMAVDGKTALISPVGDPKALAANICTLIADGDLRTRIATEGNRNISQFNWEKTYPKFEATIDATA